jgi:hypothetical protein
MPFTSTRSQSKDHFHRHSLFKKHLENSSKSDIQLTDEDIPFLMKKILKKN